MSLPQIAGETLPYDEISEVRERLEEIAPNLLQYDDLQPANFFALAEKLMKVYNVNFCTAGWAVYIIPLDG